MHDCVSVLNEVNVRAAREHVVSNARQRAAAQVGLKGISGVRHNVDADVVVGERVALDLDAGRLREECIVPVCRHDVSEDLDSGRRLDDHTDRGCSPRNVLFRTMTLVTAWIENIAVVSLKTDLVNFNPATIVSFPNMNSTPTPSKRVAVA